MPQRLVRGYVVRATELSSPDRRLLRGIAMELNPRKHLPNPNREATPRIPDADSRSALVISLFPNPLATIRSTSSSRLLALIGRTLGSADRADGAWERDDEVFPILGHLGICLQQEHVPGDRHLLRGRADLQLVVDCGVADLQADGAAHQLLEATLRGWGKNRPTEHIPASLSLARGQDHNVI
jgi:hypothetical protein